MIALRSALEATRRLDDPAGQAPAHLGLARVLGRKGDLHGALDCYHLALRIQRVLGHRHGEAMTLSRLGDTLHALGRDYAAAHAWTVTRTMIGRPGKPRTGRAVGRRLLDGVMSDHQTSGSHAARRGRP
ncbi:tetratricopeptide repeat protein [Nonomuraea sp. MG754425]|uniref:tetratricopeptide repeat protein n=1 Tax=Nonomuraea sp. MG754425 TaxID=2570319 RepID=UPI001F464A39|nr:tetratricopeptide repeat protein [Nonomuraea sp. MG754425]